MLLEVSLIGPIPEPKSIHLSSQMLLMLHYYTVLKYLCLCQLYTGFRPTEESRWCQSGGRQEWHKARRICHKASRFICQRFLNALEPEEGGRSGLCHRILHVVLGSTKEDLHYHAITTLAKISAAFILK